MIWCNTTRYFFLNIYFITNPQENKRIYNRTYGAFLRIPDTVPVLTLGHKTGQKVGSSGMWRLRMWCLIEIGSVTPY